MTYWNDWDGWTYSYEIWTRTDLLCTKTVEKGIVIYEIYRHVYIQITRLIPISSGSIDIKRSLDQIRMFAGRYQHYIYINSSELFFVGRDKLWKHILSGIFCLILLAEKSHLCCRGNFANLQTRQTEIKPQLLSWVSIIWINLNNRNDLLDLLDLLTSDYFVKNIIMHWYIFL